MIKIVQSRSRVALLSCALSLSMLGTVPARGALIPVQPITNNSGVSSTVASQVQIDVTDPGGGMLDITVTNNGTAATDFVITQFYIDDQAPALLSGFAPLPVTWGTPGTPPNLPAGNTVGFFADYTADANNPQPQNGIDLGESLTFTLSLQGAATYQDALDALNAGDARIGLHIQSIGAGGQSDSFVTPEPGSLVLLLSASTLVVTNRRRRRH